MICPKCQAECLPEFLENMAGKQEREYVQYGGNQEPAFFCPNVLPGDGHCVNLWTETSIKNWVAMRKRLKKFKVKY